MTKRIRSAIRKSIAGFALLSVELITVIVLFVFVIIIFTVVAYRVFKLQYGQFDLYVFDQVAHLITPTMTGLMEFVTFFGSHIFLIPANIALAIYFLFIKKHKWYSIKVPVVAIGGVSLLFLLKDLFGRPRPLLPLLQPVSGLSFPSGHAFMSVSFYGLLIFLSWENVYSRNWKWIVTIFLLLFILLIGFSRIYLRLHYFSDVVAGYAAGVIWLVLSIWSIRRIERYSQPVIAKANAEVRQ